MLECMTQPVLYSLPFTSSFLFCMRSMCRGQTCVHVWRCACGCRGTLMPHPVEQTKTIAHTRDVLAKAKEKADALQKRGWWSLR